MAVGIVGEDINNSVSVNQRRSLVVLEVSVPQMVGKLGVITANAMQACLLRNILSVEVVK